MTQLDPIINQPFLYVNGLLVSNDATTPNTVLDIAAGQCRDSNNVIDMILGDFLNEGYGTDNSSTSLNAAVNGLNGLDTGSLAASTMYGVYIIADSSGKHATGAILSANQTTPALPFGYDSYRRIAFWPTDSSSHFLLGYYSVGGVGTAVRTFFYDAPQATAVTAGAETSATNVNLIKFVPNFNNFPVWMYTSYVPATAGNALSMQPGNGTGFPVVITGQVATKAVTTNSLILAQSVVISTVSSPVINYKVSNSSDTAAIDVVGFVLSV
jgi:hypothetical protein